jgi:acylphosphatase
MARQLGLAGWVRNRGDGAVEAVFEGPSAAVQQMVDWCRVGPPRAEVTGLDLFEADPLEPLPGFGIRPTE